MLRQKTTAIRNGIAKQCDTQEGALPCLHCKLATVKMIKSETMPWRASKTCKGLDASPATNVIDTIKKQKIEKNKNEKLNLKIRN